MRFKIGISIFLIGISIGMYEFINNNPTVFGSVMFYTLIGLGLYIGNK